MANLDLKIDLGKVPSVMDKLRQMHGLKLGLKTAILYFKGKADDYPPKKEITREEAYGVAFFSDVQRRGFFAKLRSGEIKTPHQRRASGGFAGKWGIQEQRDGFIQAIGNNAPYAKHLVGPKQSRMMKKIGWRKIRDVFNAEKATLQRIIKEQIARSIGT